MVKAVTIALLGAASADKTRLMLTYVTSRYPSNPPKTPAESMSATVMVDGKPVKVTVVDVDPAFSPAKKAEIFRDSDVFAFCFSLVDPQSLKTVTSSLVPDWKSLTRSADTTGPAAAKRVFLIGTCFEALADAEAMAELKKKRVSPVSPHEGATAAESIGATRYWEVSAPISHNLKEAFYDMVSASVTARSIGARVVGITRKVSSVVVSSGKEGPPTPAVPLGRMKSPSSTQIMGPPPSS